VESPGFGDNQVPRRADAALQASVDGDLVLLSSVDLGFYGTDGAGASIWALVDGERTVGQVVAELEGAFDAEPGVIRQETLTFLSTLQAAGLLAG
jgi:hypothetical protein